jgi:hypothetical protein
LVGSFKFVTNTTIGWQQGTHMETVDMDVLYRSCIDTCFCVAL